MLVFLDSFFTIKKYLFYYFFNMRGRKRKNPQILKIFKDYSVPLVLLFIFLLLILNFFFWWKDEKDVLVEENQKSLHLSLDSIDTEAEVKYPWEYTSKIEEKLELYKWEKAIVKNGSLSISSEILGFFRLNKLGELKYNEDGGVSLFSSDLWVQNRSPINIDMRFAKLNIGEWSVLNLTQNDVLSTIYLLSGFVEVSNLAWNNTVLMPWQKIMIERLDASKKDIDLSLLKEPIDDYFQASDWFVKNNGSFYMDKIGQETEETWTWETVTGSVSSHSLIQLTNIKDEQSFNTQTIDINGAFLSDDVYALTIDDLDATVNRESKTFSFVWVPLKNNINDIVIRIYNKESEIIGKYLYTFYSSEGTNSSDNSSSSGLFDVKNYSLDASEFKFISPKENPYSTEDDVIMIEGLVPAGKVTKIDVNDFTLTKFPRFGTYWKYYANTEYGNLKEWLNVYEIKYYGEDGSVIYKNAFSIIKKVSSPIQTDTQNNSATEIEE